MECKICHKDYPSKYYFVTESICRECFEKMDDPEKQRLLDERDSLQPKEATERMIQGRSLQCPICQHNKFWKRSTLMNTPGLTFLGLDWTNKQAVNFICESCGYIMWFMWDE